MQLAPPMDTKSTKGIIRLIKLRIVGDSGIEVNREGGNWAFGNLTETAKHNASIVSRRYHIIVIK